MCTSVKGTVCRVILILLKIRPRGGLFLTTEEMYESRKTEPVSGKAGEDSEGPADFGRRDRNGGATSDEN